MSWAAAKFDKSGEASNQVTMVELGLAGVTLKELTNTLHKIYSSNNLIVVYKLVLRPANNNKGLECDIAFLSPNSAPAAA